MIKLISPVYQGSVWVNFMYFRSNEENFILKGFHYSFYLKEELFNQ